MTKERGSRLLLLALRIALSESLSGSLMEAYFAAESEIARHASTSRINWFHFKKPVKRKATHLRRGCSLNGIHGEFTKTHHRRRRLAEPPPIYLPMQPDVGGETEEKRRINKLNNPGCSFSAEWSNARARSPLSARRSAVFFPLPLQLLLNKLQFVSSTARPPSPSSPLSPDCGERREIHMQREEWSSLHPEIPLLPR